MSMRTKRALLRGFPWMGVLAVGVLAFGFHSLSASTGQGELSMGVAAEAAPQPASGGAASISAGDFNIAEFGKGAGSRNIVDCPDGTIWGQSPPTDPLAGWTFATSDASADPPYRVFEDHDAVGSVCDVHWWGINGEFAGGWSNCDAGPNEAFHIEFWDDDGTGIPDISADPYCSYMNVVPTKVHKGIFYAGLFELLYYGLDLDTCCDAHPGWVSIQSADSGPCWFLWASYGETGAGYAYQEYGAPEIANYDLAVCLTGEYIPQIGACCDDVSGVCNNNVDLSECSPPMRFAVDTLCDSLDPPCVGCDKVVTIEIFTDNYPGETSWELVDKANGAVVGSAGPLAGQATLHSWDVCITESGCYNFTIYDGYGDGICCAYGNGWYNVYHDGLECSGGEFGEWETCEEIGWGCGGDIPVIVGSNPPDGAIDAAKPTDVDDCGNDYGWGAVLLTFDSDASGVGAGDFTISVAPADVAPPTICDVLHPNPNEVMIELCDFIPLEHWTIITHDPSGSAVEFGYLPGDTNGDGTSSPVDVLDLIDHLNSVIVLPPWGTDVDRSGATNSADILTVIDLLNGAGCYDAWLGAALP